MERIRSSFVTVPLLWELLNGGVCSMISWLLMRIRLTFRGFKVEEYFLEFSLSGNGRRLL